MYNNMKIKLKLIVLMILSIICGARLLAAADYPIQDSDCDTASKALVNLSDAIKKNSLSATYKKAVPEMLTKNIFEYAGDPEKCVLVTGDFIKVLSIDALGEFKDVKYKPTFVKLLDYLSEFQPGDVRQHAAAALSKMKAIETVPALVKSLRDKNTFLVGYKEIVPVVPLLSIDQTIDFEKRDLKKDPYSFPIIEALKNLSSKKDFDSIKNAITEEYDLSLQGKSNWNSNIRTDMLRIAASLNGDETLELIKMHKNLSDLEKLHAYAFIQNSKIIEPVGEIIAKASNIESYTLAPDINLSFFMLSKLRSKDSKAKILALAGSSNLVISYMANIFLAKKGDLKALAFIKSKILIVPDKLKIEGLKILAELGNRNSIPLIKTIFSEDNLKLKIYSIWTLANLKVVDLLTDSKALLEKIRDKDEKDADLNFRVTLKDSIGRMETSKPVYK